MEDLKLLAKRFKALSNPNRLKLFTEILRARQASVDPGGSCLLRTIAQTLKVAPPTVSHHVKELVNAGLITTELQGKFLACAVVPEALESLRRALGPSEEDG